MKYIQLLPSTNKELNDTSNSAREILQVLIALCSRKHISDFSWIRRHLAMTIVIITRLSRCLFSKISDSFIIGNSPAMYSSNQQCTCQGPFFIKIPLLNWYAWRLIQTIYISACSTIEFLLMESQKSSKVAILGYMIIHLQHQAPSQHIVTPLIIPI